MTTFAARVRRSFLAIGVGSLVVVSGAPLARSTNSEIEQRSRVAAANLEDAIVVDCQLPGKLQKLGGMRSYLTPGRLVRISAVDCRARGGEYTIGDLSSGTLSIQRWLPLAESGEAEAQYYVARIYANGMGGVASDPSVAAKWYKRAADQNYSAAVQELGYLYEQGLGVQKDPVLALNLQRKAAGLGEELDYAWKITAAEAEGERQVAALSEQLDASNSELQAQRAQLSDTTNAMFKARSQLAKSESAALDLREQLAAAKQSKESAGDGAKVAALNRALTEREGELTAAREQMSALTVQLNDQQTKLSSRMAQSQASSMELNELLSSEREKNQALTARAAQADQRLLRSQQELSELRTQYRAEVEQLVSEREEVEKEAAKSKDQATALLAARERDLDRQKLRAASLEKALAEASRAQVEAAKSANKAPSVATQANVQALRSQLDEQQKQVKQREQEIASLKALGKQDRTALMREFETQLAARTEELQVKQRRLTALNSETETLRSEVQRLNQQREKDAGGMADEASRARASLRMAQQKLNEQRERLDQLQTEKATDMAALAQARDELQRQLSASRKASEMQLAFLRKDLEARQKDLEAKDGQIASLGERLQEQSQRFDALVAQTLSPGNGANTKTVMASTQVAATQGIGKMRSVDSRAPGLEHSLGELRSSSSGSYHAIVIGNSLYHYMESLDTPANDAKEIAQLLGQRYGFKVQLLLDATREQIMVALHDAKRTLTPQDNLLIYYAGHGDVDTASGRAFWLGVEADRDTRAGWLEADHIRAKIKEMSAKHVLLVADSCFSGAITHPKTTTIGRGLNETRLRVQWNRRARMVLTSGEVTPVADSAGDATHSVFARYFIQILRQNDNVMSGEMLSHELSGRMLAQPVQVGNNGQRQTPTYSTLQDANHDIGDFFFVPVAESVKVAALNY
ncbi:caspase family protein [Steroidobacter sp.]|uniref:caspase family protein n=1 Tax=Steroidobacter sp. TaxID=1978227 RepID=UPI001A584271|nr:caspase family protein [Steroidobacter sp.]MBL8267723.1 caspase family protein [Steroidobacter sp.]